MTCLLSHGIADPNSESGAKQGKSGIAEIKMEMFV
jgi:hypothetical protein